MKTGIIGFGVVGQAQYSIIKDKGNAVIYDLDTKKCKEPTSTLKEILSTDIIFICTPTPTIKGEHNYSSITKNLTYLSDNLYKGIVVIKSTVLLDSHITKYESILNIVYNPEFLNQNTAFEDSRKQNVILLGGNYDLTLQVQEYYKHYTSLDPYYLKFEHVTAEEAMQFKYIRNIYGAYKVLFWEFVQDTTGNARKMADLFDKINYQTEMSQVGMDGFRGFGGACFPKDVTAWNTEFKHQLTEFMLKYNEDLAH